MNGPGEAKWRMLPWWECRWGGGTESKAVFRGRGGGGEDGGGAGAGTGTGTGTGQGQGWGVDEWFGG